MKESICIFWNMFRPKLWIFHPLTNIKTTWEYTNKFTNVALTYFKIVIILNIHLSTYILLCFNIKLLRCCLLILLKNEMYNISLLKIHFYWGWHSFQIWINCLIILFCITSTSPNKMLWFSLKASLFYTK